VQQQCQISSEGCHVLTNVDVRLLHLNKPVSQSVIFCG